MVAYSRVFLGDLALRDIGNIERTHVVPKHVGWSTGGHDHHAYIVPYTFYNIYEGYKVNNFRPITGCLYGSMALGVPYDRFRVLGEVKNGRCTDVRTCDFLESHVHVTVICWSDGCIGS